MSINFKIEYETPRAFVRGVFLCDNLAAATSALGAITQEDWNVGDERVGDLNEDGDIGLSY
jgi:hypothetical protein